MFVIGAAMPPARRASSSSRGATSASAMMPSTSSISSPRRPPLITRFGLVLANFLMVLATRTASPGVPSGRSATSARAVGPVRVSPRSRSSSAVARRTRVFLYTLYSPPASASSPRRSCRSRTVRPRYSVNTTASVCESFSRTSSTTATFSGLGFSIDTSFNCSGETGAHVWGRPFSTERSNCRCPPTQAAPRSSTGCLSGPCGHTVGSSASEVPQL